MSSTEKKVGTISGIVFILVVFWGVANSYSDKPTRGETRVIAREEIRIADDSLWDAITAVGSKQDTQTAILRRLERKKF